MPQGFAFLCGFPAIVTEKEHRVSSAQDIWKAITRERVIWFNKFYIGLAKDGVAKNFIAFKPKKSFLHFIFKTNENPELSSKIEDAGLDVTYESRWKQYRVKLGGFDDYKKHEDLIKECVEAAMEYFNISEM